MHNAGMRTRSRQCAMRAGKALADTIAEVPPPRMNVDAPAVSIAASIRKLAGNLAPERLRPDHHQHGDHHQADRVSEGEGRTPPQQKQEHDSDQPIRQYGPVT